MKQLGLSLLLFGTLALWPALAHADSADDLFKEASALYAEGKVQGAYEKYLLAWKERQSVDIAANLAQTEMKLGKKADAAGHLAYALRMLPTSFSPEKRDAMKAAFKDLSASVCKVTVSANPKGATVFVADREVGLAPLADPVFVEPGKVVVRGELAGHDGDSKTVDATAGAALDVDLTLRPKSGVPITPTPSPRPIGPAIAAFSVGGVGLILGAVFVGLHAERVGEAKDLASGKPCLGDPALSCKEAVALQEEANTFGNASTGLFVVGAVGASLGTGLLIWSLTGPKSPSTKTEGSVTAFPLLSPSQAGMGVFGTF
ncbi:MAG: PEGA domain-containing protein [Patescibacteria group bacterium]